MQYLQEHSRLCRKLLRDYEEERQTMKIDRKHVEDTFRKYTNAYDSTDEKIKLKIAHTYRVAGLCERIAQSENLSAEEVELSWLLGMLHDVGRFEQLRRYDTFNDAMSIDHAKLGAEILFGSENKIRDYIKDGAEDLLVETAILTHNAYRLPEELDERTEKFCHILRDADKIDILRVNVEVPLEEIYNTTIEDVQNAVVTEAVMDNFFTHCATPRRIKKSSVDHLVGHISLVYELVFSESLRIVKNDGYLEQLLHFESRNPHTQKQFDVLRRELEHYLQERT